jgi:hypothetical protein
VEVGFGGITYYGSAQVGHLYFFGSVLQTPHNSPAMSNWGIYEDVFEVCFCVRSDLIVSCGEGSNR